MTRLSHNFRAAEELPIPEDAKPGKGWTEQMLEMADHIGPYRTLQLVEAFGGMRIYIPADPERGKVYDDRGSIVDVVGIAAAAKLSAIYRCEYLHVPTARYALSRAKRRPIIAAVKAGRMTGAQAARMLGTSRPYLANLVNQTDEGEGKSTWTRRPQPDPGQMDLFGDGEDEADPVR